MKKILFSLFLVIFVLVIILNDNNKIINKTIINQKIDINYPYFSSSNINGYLLNYINKNIYEEEYDKLIIDYDYNSGNKMLNIYKTIIKDNLVNEKNIIFKIEKNGVKKLTLTKEVNDYDFHNNKYVDKNTKLVALTFDDGPNYNTIKVVDILNKYNVTATFFLTGKNIKGNEKIVKKLYESNMEIGNHTYSHLLLTKYNEQIIKEEISKTNSLINDIVGETPTLLRPSYGSVNNTIKKVSNMPIIIWNIDTLDWKYKDSSRISDKILSKVKDGDIILMHDRYTASLNSLEKFIPKLLKEGYQIVSVSELFYYKEIELQKGKVYGYARK